MARRSKSPRKKVAERNGEKSAQKNGREEVVDAWLLSVDEAVGAYSVDVAKGHTSADAAALREKWGPNELDKEESKSLWELFVEQFDDLLVKILLASAVVSFGISAAEEASRNEEFSLSTIDPIAFVEPGVIMLILILNAIVGVWQESNAENALEALKDMQPRTARVKRNGVLDSSELAVNLVPGDIVEMVAGDMAPADCRVLRLETTTFGVAQAALTGESTTVFKDKDTIDDPDAQIADKTNMVFSGTVVANGHVTAIVQATGMRTEFGKIQASITQAKKDSEDDSTPLGRKLDAFGVQLANCIAVVCLLVWIINYRHFFVDGSFDVGQCTYYFKIAVALAVAAIPEGLPAVITTCLALGTRKMAAKNAIVRKLPSVETLGCTTVICSDKTGTLTTNQMSVVELVTVDKKKKVSSLEVTGSTYDPAQGSVVGNCDTEAHLMAAKVCMLCNDAKLSEGEEGNGVVVDGAPTEGALVVLGKKIAAATGTADDDLRAPRLAKLEFNRKRKSMGVICADTGSSRGPDQNVLYVKGAPESVLDRCSYVLLEDGSRVKLTKTIRSKITDKVAGMSSDALRCLALAFNDTLSDLPGEYGELCHYDGSENHAAHHVFRNEGADVAIESGLTLVGVAAMRDPPRAAVKGSIEECRGAGIRVIIITGDNQLTAEAIARQIGLFAADEDLEDVSFVGRSFDKFPREEKIRLLKLAGESGRGMVFSRAEPAFKQSIVKLLKSELDEIVAMTGDGVNDAPALAEADIGIAMGIAGTEVAKEASDMVLADDNFATIVHAVEEGRAIYNNMKAFIRYMISSNIGEVASLFITAALGMPEGLIPVQLLWVNLVTDGPPATALGFNPADTDIMKKKPRSANDVLINQWTFIRYMVIGIYVGVATVGVFAAWYTSTEFMGIDLSADGHPAISFEQLRTFEMCESGQGAFANNAFSGVTYQVGDQTIKGCEYFGAEGKKKASTLSLSVLVTIEMMNALNALSEDNSLLVMPPWINPWLIAAMVLSFGLHFLILYVEPLADMFSISPLSWNEWQLVLLFSVPVIIIDEVLKCIGRAMNKQQ